MDPKSKVVYVLVAKMKKNGHFSRKSGMLVAVVRPVYKHTAKIVMAHPVTGKFKIIARLNKRSAQKWAPRGVNTELKDGVNIIRKNLKIW